MEYYARGCDRVGLDLPRSGRCAFYIGPSEPLGWAAGLQLRRANGNAARFNESRVRVESRATWRVRSSSPILCPHVSPLLPPPVGSEVCLRLLELIAGHVQRERRKMTPKLFTWHMGSFASSCGREKWSFLSARLFAPRGVLFSYFFLFFYLNIVGNITQTNT
jgi:hypothetical protein